MKRWIGAAVIGVWALAGAALSEPAAAASMVKAQNAGISDATHVSARRHYRRYDRYGPYYYARPHYYRPYPYNVPAPFVFGFGFGPAWY